MAGEDRKTELVQRKKLWTMDYGLWTRRGFTLIELLIAMLVSMMIAAALYFSLKSALESWQASQDQLLLQQVSSQIMEELIEGLPESYGLRDALEIVESSAQQIKVVMPWTDDTHDVYSGIYTYTLNKHIKPGTGLPIAEALLPESRAYKVVPITLLAQGKSEAYPEVRINLNLPAGSRLHFTFHPDYQKDADALSLFGYDSFQKAVFIEDKDGRRDISRNIFGVKLTDFLIRYFDNTNTEIGQAGSLSNQDIPAITALEIAFKAKSKNGNLREIVSFVSLRNAPGRSGNLTLREGSKIPIPNSKEIKAFFLTNLSGIDNNDAIILEASEISGKVWRLRVQFSKPLSSTLPLIESYAIEYPPGNPVYSERPRTPAELGLNLLNLSPNGVFDYDDDQMQDSVILDGKVILEVKKMDIAGASVFVKP